VPQRPRNISELLGYWVSRDPTQSIMYFPSENEFLKLTKKGNLIPVYREIWADLETPVSAYLKVAGDSTYSFLLESVEGEEKVARYSFLAKDPELIFKSRGRTATLTRLSSGKTQTKRHVIRSTPLELIREIMSAYQLVEIPGLPRFCGGLVGYIGYDAVRFFEKLPNQPKDDLQLPDILMVLAKDLIIFDQRNHKIQVVSCAAVGSPASLDQKRKAYRDSVRKIERLMTELRKPLGKGRFPTANHSTLKIHSNIGKDRFVRHILEAKKKIRAGDIIQVVLSQRFSVSVKTDTFAIYRNLRTLNPSPYMYFLNFAGLKVAGSSPELLVRCEDGVVETRPIAGTRRRGKDEREDDELARDLLNDPKEKAEHIMLVDLGRNDLGRVCERGTVKITEFMAVEKYSHVMHIVSNVKGRLKKNRDSLDALRAAFPAGTVSGAPKIRAMEIIDELENVKRGPYAGCIGYLSFSGNLDTCITIRTIIVLNGRAYVQAGAGIVADSNPLREYQETVNKAKAQILAIQSAHRQSG